VRASRNQVRSLVAALALAVTSTRAGATYSIVGADTSTRATGGAGTSCLSGTADVYIIYGGVPGVGTVHAQSVFDQFTHDEAVRALASGESPTEVIADVTAPDFDPIASERQYGVVDVTGRSAAFTGADDFSFAGDRQGGAKDLVYSVQGNYLTSRAVIDQAADAFEASGCDLPDRLMRALEAGATGGEGDHRCTETRGIPSDSAFIEVDLPDAEAGSYLELHVPYSGAESPLTELRSAFDAWRLDHPCPAPRPDGGGDLGATGVSSAATAGGSGANGAGGCACRLPHGRGPKNGLAWPLGVALGLLLRLRRAAGGRGSRPERRGSRAASTLRGRPPFQLRRAKSPTRVRGAHPRLP
jgi:uncharacterized Ntn-hydrolase superfamily protein